MKIKYIIVTAGVLAIGAFGLVPAASAVPADGSNQPAKTRICPVTGLPATPKLDGTGNPNAQGRGGGNGDGTGVPKLDGTGNPNSNGTGVPKLDGTGNPDAPAMGGGNGTGVPKLDGTGNPNASGHGAGHGTCAHCNR